MSQAHDLREVVNQFQIGGEFIGAAPYGSGHINDSYAAVFRHATGRTRYLVQRINHNIFKDPVAMMENIGRVTSHLGEKLKSDADRDRRVLSLIPSKADLNFHRDEAGNFWRVYRFIERARSLDAVQQTDQAYEAAKAFGQFQSLLADMPEPRLHDTIPDFHHTPKRFEALKDAIRNDRAGRVRTSQAEIEFALKREALTASLLSAGLPERVTHNDTKLNNVLLDDETGEGVCVIDLDTVMPGLALYDFGDMVRTTTSTAPEDERDLSKVGMRFDMFEALMRGYLSAAGFLTQSEVDLLAKSGEVITFEIGIRFLADHLNGDTYFKVHREGHNLDRCRTQFQLVESIADQENAMMRLVRELAG